MRKLWLSLAVASLVTSASWADLTWGTGNLFGNIDDFDLSSNGWLVQMYRDFGNNTDLSEVTFNLDGTPTGAGNSGSDVLLTAFTTPLSAVETFGTVVDFLTTNLDYTDIDGFHLYTVILDTTDWASATTANRTFVLDESSFLLDSGGNPANPRSYSVPNTNPGNHEWQNVIPEPGTMGLLATGLVGLLAIRRKKMI